MKNSAVLLCAGSGSRMGENKMLIKLCGVSVMERSLLALIKANCFCSIVIVCSNDTKNHANYLLEKYRTNINLIVTMGGSSRPESVLLGLCALENQNCDIVAVHDGARCLIDSASILHSIESASIKGSGVTAIMSVDTIKEVSGTAINNTLDRSHLAIIQTPQTFRYKQLLDSYKKCFSEGFSGTDDASFMEHCGSEIHISIGSPFNLKLTTAADIPLFNAILEAKQEKKRMRIGYGEDTHKLVYGRALILGGINIPYEKGLLGHSDADVLTHAIMDALLGAAAMGDIGKHFPDSDDKYKGASSLALLCSVKQLIEAQGYSINNIDATIIAQKPKLAPYIQAILENISNCLDISIENVSIKATTSEGLGFEGRLEGITARAVCTLI